MMVMQLILNYQEYKDSSDDLRVRSLYIDRINHYSIHDTDSLV